MAQDPLYDKIIGIEELLLSMKEQLQLLVSRRRDDQDTWLDNQEVMQKFKISERTLKRRRSDGTFPFKKIKGKCYYRLTDIMAAFTSEHESP